MAKLLIDENGEMIVQTHIGDMTIVAYCELLRETREIKVSELENLMGVDHGGYPHAVKKRSQRAPLTLKALDAMGFEIIIWNPEGLKK